jgi:SpoVK/Ycf46/Vps4 family AAA+-type ATPase
VQFLLEILKILEGALGADRAKVLAYGHQLAEKIEATGEPQAAERIKRVLANPKMRSLEPARLAEARLPVDGESRLALADESEPRIEEVSFFVNGEKLSLIQEFLSYIKNADLLLAEGIGISPSLLLYGPPGCGKSELARYIAAQLNLPLITARFDSIVSSFLGNTAKNLRILFDHASARPCVLFLDEFDAIAKLRDDQHELGELKRVVVSLLQNIDKLDKKTVLLAATNHSHLLDSAVWRRFTYKINLDLPTEEIRVLIIKNILKNEKNDKLISDIAKVTDGFSGDTIKKLMENALRESIVKNTKIIDEYSILRNILYLKGLVGDNVDESIHNARMLNHKVFTFRRLSQIFGRSIGTISKNSRLKENTSA